MTSVAQHFALLRDRPRLDAFTRAIEALVSPGMVVADLGAGIGTLAILAAKAGAQRVYAVESDTALSTWIAQLAAANGVSDRVVILTGDSRSIDVPEPVDLVIYDDADIMDLRGSVVATLADARRRWLKPEGHTIPAQLHLNAAGTMLARPQPPADIRLTPPMAAFLQQPQAIRLNSEAILLTEPEVVRAGALELLGASDMDHQWIVPADRDAQLTGLVCWLSLTLHKHIELDLGPGANPSAYPQIFFPIPPIEVSAGDPISLRLAYRAPKAAVGYHSFWEWSIEAPKGAASSGSFESMDLSSLLELKRK